MAGVRAVRDAGVGIEMSKTPTRAELLEALTDMVIQHCQYFSKPARLDHGCLSANETAFELLERAGIIRILKTRPNFAVLIQGANKK